MKVNHIRVYRGEQVQTMPMAKKFHEEMPKVTPRYQRQIDKCLNCTKPASECKGTCS